MTASAASAQQFVAESIEYLTVAGATAVEVTDPTFQHAMVNQKELILKKLRSVRIARTEATRILKLLQASPFGLAARSEIVTLVMAVVAHDPTGAVGQALSGTDAAIAPQKTFTMQSCLNFHKLATKDLWATIKDETKPFSMRIDAIVCFIINKLGMPWSNEATYVHIVACFIMGGCRIHEDAFQISSNDAFSILHDLKSRVKLLRTKVRVPHSGTIGVYPQSVEEFEQKYQQAFAICYPGGRDEVPEQCPLPEAQLVQLRLRLPMRKTHCTVAAQMPGCQRNAFATSATAQLRLQMMNNMMASAGYKELPPLMPGPAPEPASVPAGAPASVPAARLPISDGKPEPTASADETQSATVAAAAPTVPGKNVADMANALLSTLGPKKKSVKTQKGKKKKRATKAKASIGSAPKILKRKGATKVKASIGSALAFPGMPKAARPPIEHKSFTIVTDIPSQCWRVKRGGSLVKCASFAKDPKAAWAKVLSVTKCA